MAESFITAVGRFLPGEPISNDQMEERLGRLHGKPSRARERILKQNGIQSRHYALSAGGVPQFRVSEMAARAIRHALEQGPACLEDIDFLAAATTQGDLLVPGFASEVHRELKNPPCEVLSVGGVCASGLAAVQAAHLQVASASRKMAVACASEMPSRILRASWFERQARVAEGGTLPLDTEFLRWMLSDGAGAAVLGPRPRGKGLSLRVDFIELRSFANENPNCMFSGGLTSADGKMGPTWLGYPHAEAAAREGVLNLQQDVRLLDRLLQLGVDGFFDLVERGRVDPRSVDWMVCHYSSHHFRAKVMDLLRRGGVEIPEERWFSNLTQKGNTGSASLFIMLEELLNEGRVRPGQRLMCVVPESGGFICGYMHLTVVGEEAVSLSRPVLPAPEAPRLELPSNNPVAQSLVRRLTRTWIEFECRIREVPIVARLESGSFTLEDYQLLLRNLRPQVVEGSRWIARAASSLDHAELRPLFLGHARDEQLDYQMLERDYVSVGGALEDIRRAPKNVGSEAFSAFMFHRAGMPNPLDLLGAMFIIEGLGNRLASRWASLIRTQLQLDEAQVSFLAYHGKNDETHFDKLEHALGTELLTPALAGQVVRTAEVVARLYRLQLEEVRRE